MTSSLYVYLSRHSWKLVYITHILFYIYLKACRDLNYFTPSNESLLTGFMTDKHTDTQTDTQTDQTKSIIQLYCDLLQTILLFMLRMTIILENQVIYFVYFILLFKSRSKTIDASY